MLSLDVQDTGKSHIRFTISAYYIIIIIIIIDNFCIALFSGVPKLTALYNVLQHFLSFTNVIHDNYDN